MNFVKIYVGNKKFPELFDNNLHMVYVYETISAYIKRSKFDSRIDTMVDGKHFVRLSYMDISALLSWCFKPVTIKYYLKLLAKNNFIEIMTDGYTHKYGNLYAYTDKIFNYMTETEFNEMCEGVTCRELNGNKEV